jgi:hypothetical protein
MRDGLPSRFSATEHMAVEIEITGRDRYLIAEALLVAAAELRKRHHGHSVVAADMEKLLWSFFTHGELQYFGLIDRPRNSEPPQAAD